MSKKEILEILAMVATILGTIIGVIQFTGDGGKSREDLGRIKKVKADVVPPDSSGRSVKKNLSSEQFVIKYPSEGLQKPSTSPEPSIIKYPSEEQQKPTDPLEPSIIKYPSEEQDVSI